MIKSSLTASRAQRIWVLMLLIPRKVHSNVSLILICVAIAFLLPLFSVIESLASILDEGSQSRVHIFYNSEKGFGQRGTHKPWELVGQRHNP
jgi:hypothetical protein